VRISLRLQLNSRATTLHIVHNLLLERPLLRETHVARESSMGLPLGRGSWGRLLEHAVDLLEREPLGLGYEQVRVHEAAGAEGAPDEEDAGA
jgi:hypothetical protein